MKSILALGYYKDTKTTLLLRYIEKHYGDDGCMVAKHCEQCPLRCCVLEDSNAYREYMREQLLDPTKSLRQNAIALGVSKATIARWKRQIAEVQHA